MKSYNKFIGIDIGKFSFHVGVHDSNVTKEYENNLSGIEKFIKEFDKELPKGLCILEPTGSYEIELLMTLCHKGFAVHRVQTRKVKNFIRSWGNGAKTDRLDAKNLAHYGLERANQLDIYSPCEQRMELYVYAKRRADLKQMIVAEKNRFQTPLYGRIKDNIQSMLKVLEEELKVITDKINELIEQNKVMKEKKKILRTIPGIGPIVANELLILLPELGHLSRRAIASLVGLAPISKDSGKMKGYRRTGYGRAGIKGFLFLAAMAARNSKSKLKTFYEELIARGKRKMVALTALMRKIIVIANAKLKTLEQHS